MHSDPFLQQLAELVHNERTANKWILVPTNDVGWMLSERLVREGTNWINLRFTTPFALALDAAAPGLIERNIDPCPDLLGPSLLQSILAEHHPQVLLPGVAKAMWTALHEARMAGVTPGAYEQPYLEYLLKHQLADRAMVYAHAGATKVSPDDFILPYPYHIWNPLERHFFEGLPARHLTPQATTVQAPRRASRRQPMEVQPQRTIHLFYAGRRDLEFQEILRRIDRPFDEVELAAHSEDLPLLLDVFTEAGCPVTFAEGLPLALSRPAQALNGFLQWMEGGYRGSDIRELLMANLAKAPPNSWTSARLVRSAQIGWGALDYRRKLTALAERSEQNGAEWLKSQAVQCRQLLAWFESLFSLFATFELKAFLQNLQTVLEQHLEQEELATRTLRWMLEELKPLPGSWTLETACRLVRERIRELRWNASRPRPGHLHVATFEQVGLSGRPVCFLTGLEEGRMSLPVEDCILDDRTRAKLHPFLVQSRDRLDEHRFHVNERLATLQGKVTFSFAARGREGQEQLPSWLFVQQIRSQHPELDTLKRILDWLGEPAQPWAAEEAELRREDPLTLYPDLFRGNVAERARASSRFTVYDGLVESAANRWHQDTFSVSTLQSLAACPYQFFLTRGLRLYPAPQPMPDLDRWLDAASRGHILHALYAEHGRARRRGESVDLLALLDRELSQQLPPPSPTVEQLEREGLVRDLEHFVQLEARRQREPVGIEVAFGLGADDEPLSCPEALQLDGLKLRGRIDRIEKMDGGYAVVDFKTGRRLELARGRVYQAGTLVQHALYALAAEQLLDAPVVETGYLFTSAHANVEWVGFARPEEAPLRKVLELTLHPLTTGVFAHTHDTAGQCSYCDFRPACHGHRDEHSKAKLGDDRLSHRRLLLEQP